MTRILAGLSEIAGRYDVLLCDVWGVIHDGAAAFAGPCAALGRWRAERGPVVLISNAPRPADDVVPQLDALGVPRASWSALVTSGDATRTLLAARAPGPVWRIGPDRDAPLYEGLGLDFTGPEAAALISCTGPYDDETETPDDYRAVLKVAAAKGLEMICANPDRVVQRGARLIYCAGALAELYETLGGRAIMAGKPCPPIYDLALDAAGASDRAPVDRRRVLVVGDSLITDLAGAATQKLDALFVAGGIHRAEAVKADGRVDEAAVRRLLTEASQTAAFAVAELGW